MPFVAKLDKVRHIEEQIRKHDGVRHTMSLAQFFPVEMPDESYVGVFVKGGKATLSEAVIQDLR